MLQRNLIHPGSRAAQAAVFHKIIAEFRNEIRNKTETDIRKAKGMVNVTIPFLFRLKAAKPKEESINVVSSGHDIVQGKIESRIKVFYITSGIAEQNSMNTVLASNDNRCCSVDVSSVV